VGTPAVSVIDKSGSGGAFHLEHLPTLPHEHAVGEDGAAEHIECLIGLNPNEKVGNLFVRSDGTTTLFTADGESFNSMNDGIVLVRFTPDGRADERSGTSSRKAHRTCVLRFNQKG
jgi:hypothetical protein